MLKVPRDAPSFVIYPCASDLEGRGIGEWLIKQAALASLTAGATHLRVTTSEEAADIFGEWFERQGFAARHWDKDRYRSGITELEWQAAIATILS